MHNKFSGYQHFTLAVTIVFCVQCSNSLDAEFLYMPQVTFTGYINGNFDSLAGNRSWPNRCELIGDTVRIFCHSTFFVETEGIRHGDMLRLDLLPDSGDGFEKRNSLFHLARYYERNESYTINKGDTIDNAIRFESEIGSFSRIIGGTLELTEIHIATPPVSGTGGQYLTIKNGHLFGSIHCPR